MFSLGLYSSAGAAQQTCSAAQAKVPGQVDAEARAAAKNRPGATEFKPSSVQATIAGKKVRLKFQTYPASTSPKKGSIVSLCGGPGFSCTQSGRPVQFPPDYDVVTLDYLGIGQNLMYNSPPLMSIDSQGEAVAAIAKQLTGQKIILYGQSFGTTVATAAAAKLTGGGKAISSVQLKGVVLEGVVGRSGLAKYGEGYVSAAATAWSLLTDQEKDKFKASYLKFTHDMSAAEKRSVDAYITEVLLQGSLPVSEILKTFGDNPQTLKAYIKSLTDYRAQVSSPQASEQYRAAGCQVIKAGGTIAAPAKMFGGLVDMTYALCAFRRLWRPLRIDGLWRTLILYGLGFRRRYKWEDPSHTIAHESAYGRGLSEFAVDPKRIRNQGHPLDLRKRSSNR